MKKLLFFFLTLILGFSVSAQAPHLFEHTYPVVTAENPEIRGLMDSVSIDNIKANIEHLCSYHNRRCDSRYIWEVQDWLTSRYEQFGVDTIMLHDFKINKPDFPEETADNVIAVQWGTKTPQEFVICGAHYDSWNPDGSDPDTIRAPGADDNASGVAGILETARLLCHHTFDRTIIYANWCAEEIGLIGSTAYAVDCAAQNMDIVGYFNLDMTGYLEEGSDIHVHLMYTTQDSLIANFVFNFSHVYFPEMPIRQNWLAWGDSDYSSFNRNGYPAVHPFEDVHASSPFIHSRQDILGMSVNNLNQSKRFTELNLGLVATLAGINNDGIVETKSINATVFPNPTLGTVTILTDDGLQNIGIFNVLGQNVKAQNYHGQCKCTLDTSDLASGIYVVRIMTESGSIAKRLVVN
jgi:hypothetical protein